MDEFIISSPYDRDIRTKRLSPSLASQAPIVNNTMAVYGMCDRFILFIIVIINILVKSIASKQNKHIRKWENCKMRVIVAKVKEIIISRVELINIGLNYVSLIYKINALY